MGGCNTRMGRMVPMGRCRDAIGGVSSGLMLLGPTAAGRSMTRRHLLRLYTIQAAWQVA
ncbi:hypothetical protein Hsw_PA0130 (plasmid) [Hymenobacter swuensis DY53]|uniref:Uncharacterized protein n=1 Tax=Hymenobacter swuensis DY53 TaxID=1227739 RepID=W8ESG2_9BACT|nr:hypothetical protein Hsw_PA0130 [Hymenobacter swuensis DY53]